MDPDKFTKIYSCDVFENCAAIRFNKDGKHVYFESNKGEDVNLVSLMLLDPETGKTELVESDRSSAWILAERAFLRLRTNWP